MAACSPISKRVEKKFDPLMNYVHVYGKMTKNEEGKYTFSEFTLSKRDNHIRLNDLTHFYPTQEMECSKGIGSEDNALCSSNDTLFREKAVDIGDLFKNTVGNAVMGYATVGLGIQAYYTIRFNEDLYQKGLSEALESLDRTVLIKNIDNMIKSKKKEIYQINSEIKQLKFKIEKEINLRSKIVDLSGLYFGKKPRIKVVGRTIESSIINNHKNSWSDIVQLEKDLDSETDKDLKNIVIAVECDHISGFNYDEIGSDQIWAYGDIMVDKITFKIKSKKNVNLIICPKVEDDMVIVKVDANGRFNFTNKTLKYVKFQSLSLYINEDVNSMTEISLELPPKSNKDFYSLGSFDNYNQKLLLKNVTAKQLKKRIKFGLAAKYIVVDSNKERTVFAENRKMMIELSTL
jgi:hypothetical protein